MAPGEENHTLQAPWKTWKVIQTYYARTDDKIIFLLTNLLTMSSFCFSVRKTTMSGSLSSPIRKVASFPFHTIKKIIMLTKWTSFICFYLSNNLQMILSFEGASLKVTVFAGCPLFCGKKSA